MLLDTLKETLRTIIGLSPDAVLVLAGLACFLVTCLIVGRPLSWPWALLPGFCLSLILEAWEIWDHYGFRGLLESDVKGLGAIFLRHARDILLMNVGPLLIVLAAHQLARTSED